MILPGVASLFGGYAFAVERRDIEVNHYHIAVRHLPPEFEGFTISHLTDLHYGPFMGTAFFERLVEQVNGLRSDIVVCTGDYVLSRNSVEEIDGIWPILSKLQAGSGVYSVLGNHDHWAGAKRSLYWLEKSGQSLRHRRISIQRGENRLWLIGSGDLWEDYRPLGSLLEGIPQGDCRIVLAHNPDTADRVQKASFDLMLSGHTHGGQVRLPLVGAPFLPVRNKDYTMGLVISQKGMPVFISKGVGTTLPVRFNCPPEIAVIKLARA